MFESIEKKLEALDKKAEAEAKTAGEQSVETKNAIEALGTKQRELAEQLLNLEQRRTAQGGDTKREGWGDQFIKSDRYDAFIRGDVQKVRMEVKNTISGDDATVAPDRRPGIVPGAFQPLTIEQFLNSVPTSSNAIEYTKENTYTNNAAETAEAAEKPESAVTFSLVNTPVQTIAHWLKITRQLASDNAALAAYVDQRLRYGVNRRVEAQLVTGDGVSPNLSGFMDSGNFTAHGYADAALGSTLKKLVLINKIKYDCWSAGYVPNGIVMNPADWADLENELITTNANAVRISYTEGGTPRVMGLPVILSIGMTADNVAVGAFNEAYTVYNREGVVVDMSDSDDDNFTKNLVTIRAERRLAMVTEVPAAVRAGDLTPA